MEKKGKFIINNKIVENIYKIYQNFIFIHLFYFKGQKIDILLSSKI